MEILRVAAPPREIQAVEHDAAGTKFVRTQWWAERCANWKRTRAEQFWGVYAERKSDCGSIQSLSMPEIAVEENSAMAVSWRSTRYASWTLMFSQRIN